MTDILEDFQPTSPQEAALARAIREVAGMVAPQPSQPSPFGTPPELIPEGAVEFVSGGMRALRFKDSYGHQRESRILSKKEYALRYTYDSWGNGYVGANMEVGACDSHTYPWLRYWMQRFDQPFAVSLKSARESALQVLSDAEERLAEERESDGDALEMLQRYRTADQYGQAGYLLAMDAAAAEIERLLARVGELESDNEEFEQIRDEVDSFGIDCSRVDTPMELVEALFSHAKQADDDSDCITLEHREQVTGLRAERDAAIRERGEARAEVTRWQKIVELRDKQLEESGDAFQLENGHLAARISELESQLASHELDVKTSMRLQEDYLSRAERAESQLAEVRGMYEGLRGGLVETMTQVGSGSETYEVLHEAIARFPALPSTESKEQEG